LRRIGVVVPPPESTRAGHPPRGRGPQTIIIINATDQRRTIAEVISQTFLNLESLHRGVVVFSAYPAATKLLTADPSSIFHTRTSPL
jgi:hypothetical protein